MRRLALSAAVALSVLAQPTAAEVPCGGDFGAFRAAMERAALAQDRDPARTAAFFGAARQDPRVLRADRSQGVFRMGFIDFSRRLISQSRLDTGRAMARRHADLFARARADYGVPAGILLAFWAFETDFGQVQGDFNTLNALMTLAHDCRRPGLFQPQVMAALSLYERGAFDLATTGAWAGEIGMVQMLPADILARGVDGDGDGRVLLKTSVPDAILSGARMLQALGWRAGEPWLQEVTVPDGLDWSLAGLQGDRPTADWAALGVAPRKGDLPPGLQAALILPQGRKGPAFLAYPNFRVLFDWNQSFVYVTTAAYFATRLEGADRYLAGTPDPELGLEDMKTLQRRLAARGHDVGAVDGILGAGTRAAVRAEQMRLGLPADGWPTLALVKALQ